MNWGLKFAKHKNQTRFYHQKSSNIMGHRQKNISRLSKNITQGGLTLCFAILHWPQWLSGLHAGNRLLSGVVLHEQLFVFLRIQTRFAGRKQCSMETTWTKIAKTHGSFKYGYFWWIFFCKDSTLPEGSVCKLRDFPWHPCRSPWVLLVTSLRMKLGMWGGP